MTSQMRYFALISLIVLVLSGLVVARELTPEWKGKYEPLGELDVERLSSAELAELGREVFANAPCLSCHTLNGRGASGPGPDLSGIGAEHDAASIETFIRNPAAQRPGTVMPPVSSLGLDDGEIKAIAAFLASQTEGEHKHGEDGHGEDDHASEPGETTPKDSEAEGTEPVTPAGSFDDSAFPTVMREKCTACHTLENVPKYQAAPEDKDWAGVVDLMQMFGAEVDDAQAAEIVDYLNKEWPLP